MCNQSLLCTRGPLCMMTSTYCHLVGWVKFYASFGICLVYNQQAWAASARLSTPSENRLLSRFLLWPFIICGLWKEWPRQSCWTAESLRLIVGPVTFEPHQSFSGCRWCTFSCPIWTICPPVHSFLYIYRFQTFLITCAFQTCAWCISGQSSSFIFSYTNPPLPPTLLKRGSLTPRLSITCSISCPKAQTSKTTKAPNTKFLNKEAGWAQEKDSLKGRLQLISFMRVYVPQGMSALSGFLHHYTYLCPSVWKKKVS